MTSVLRRCLASTLLAGSLLLALPATGATPPPAPSPSPAAPERNDYSNPKFVEALRAGLQHFYRREFKDAESEFQSALGIIPDNTIAISFLNASAATSSGALDVLINVEEDAPRPAPRTTSPTYVLDFRTCSEPDGRDRTQTRAKSSTRRRSRRERSGAHVGLGILR